MGWIRAWLWCMFWAICACGSASADGYGRPELLVDSAWLAVHGGDKGVRVMDVRDEASYKQGHIPGAVWLDEGPLRNAADRDTWLPTPDTLAKNVGRLGIDNSTRVIVYDEGAGRSAARLWYILNTYGHRRAALLNGGWKAWTVGKLPVSQETVAVKPARFVTRQKPALDCSAPELTSRRSDVVVLDARSPEEYKQGRVPGAVNLDWSENVSRPAMTFKTAGELRALYSAKGITPDKEVVVYCASGGRASHTVFTLALLGYRRLRNYYGSWSDYAARPELPVEK